ncbi:Imm21 family immunity protein [Streptomyces sp. NPDC091412]|uniref:Imm21 family immunity protein n=1 Tax=Streptomyces sp. NPDC091412 TaxID=3366002 RepID=UPI00381C4B06
MGGPLIVVPESARRHWTGPPPNYPEDEGDYGRACSVEELNGIIEVGPPTRTRTRARRRPRSHHFLPEHSLLVRRLAGDPDVDYSRAVAELLPQVVWDSRVEWVIQGATVRPRASSP